jgi:hypothetical protein
MNRKSIFLPVVLACSINLSAMAQSGSAQPHLLVYKTKGDYKNYVPVMLSDDKSRIISYPDPKDIKAGGDKLMP